MTTPNINALGLPFKKRTVENSEQFRGIWSEKKEYVGRVGGKGASYQTNKAQRRSEEWPWPDSPGGKRGRIYNLYFDLCKEKDKVQILLHIEEDLGGV